MFFPGAEIKHNWAIKLNCIIKLYGKADQLQNMYIPQQTTPKTKLALSITLHITFVRF